MKPVKFLSFLQDYKGGIDCRIFKNKEGNYFSKFFLFHQEGEKYEEATQLHVADHLTIMSLEALANAAETLYVKQSEQGNYYLTDRYSEKATMASFMAMVHATTKPAEPEQQAEQADDEYLPYEEEEEA